MSETGAGEGESSDDGAGGRSLQGERCRSCNGVRGRVIARVHVVKKYNDGFKVHEYHYLRLTHRKVLRDGKLKRTYCYVKEVPGLYTGVSRSG